MRRAPAISDYVACLSELAADCDGQPLNPNELRVVLQVRASPSSVLASELEVWAIASAPRTYVHNWCIVSCLGLWLITYRDVFFQR